MLQDFEKEGLAKFNKDNPSIKVAPNKNGDLKELQKKNLAKQKDFDPAKVWNDALAKGGVDPGLIIATSDFLFEAGQFAHAAEFLKANLRHGVIVRPWVYEALAVALEASGGDPGRNPARAALRHRARSDRFPGLHERGPRHGGSQPVRPRPCFLPAGGLARTQRLPSV